MKSIQNFTQSTESLDLNEQRKVRGGQLFLTSKLVIVNLDDGTKTTTTVRDRKGKAIINTRVRNIN
ncbi:MAG: hypothetical protein AB8F95_00410 [Bacteroidia bacterium]